ncbi:MAG TPA: tetratricopeptide repeat protein [Pirellulales bacterium]|nr:tetratricopeptide repeat protein [Pirellulales bacterium]
MSGSIRRSTHAAARSDYRAAPAVCAKRLAAWMAISAAVSSTVSAEDTKPDAAATRDYAVAVGLQNKKLYPQAAARWSKFIDTYPKDERLDRAHHYLGTCQLQAGEFDKAAATFRLALQKFPQFTSRDASQFNLALALYNLALKTKKPEEFKIAAESFAVVPATFPQSKQAAGAILYQGECLYAAGDATAAVGLYEKLIASYPQSELVPDARYALGAAQQDLGLDEASAATFQAFLTAHAVHPQANECKLRLGLAQLRMKKYPEAAQTLAQAAAIADFAQADLALLRQAQCVQEQGQLDQAAALFLSLPQRFPKSAYTQAAQTAAGKTLYQAGKFAEAQAALAAGIAANENAGNNTAGGAEAAPEASYWLAKTLVKLNQAPAALVEADRAVQAYAQSKLLPQLQLGRIDVLYELPDRRKEAVPLYLQFAAQHPDHELAPQAAYMAALAALTLGEHAEAHKHAIAFLADARYAKHALAPELTFIAAESLVLVAGANDAVPQAVEAEKLYHDLIANYPMHRHAPQSLVRVGLCLYLQKKYDAVVAELTPVFPKLVDPALAAEARLLVGRAHRDAGRLPLAVASLEDALRAKPDWTRADEVSLVLADSQRAQVRPAEAVAELNRLLSAYPMSRLRDEALYQLGEIAQEQEKFDDAIKQYETLLSQFPMSTIAPRAAYAVGRAKFAKQDYAGAVTALTVVVDRFAMSDIAPRAKYVRGLAQQRLSQFQPAIADLQAFLAAKPPSDDALDARYAVALCQMGLKQPDQAVATLTALLAEAPKYAHADNVYYELAFAYDELKKAKEAADTRKLLATSLADSPLAAESWFRVGEYHENAKQWADAAAAYAAGLPKAKERELKEKLQFKLGWSHYQAEKFAEAAGDFQSQLQAFPEGPLLADATYLAGECLFRQDKFAEALPWFARSVEQKQEKYLPRALYRSGACAAALKQWPASEAHYQALVTQFPKFELISEARYGLGWAMQNQEKLPQAKAVYEQVTKETETETAAKARFMIGECAFREKKFEEAVEHFLTAALGYPYEEWQALGHFEAGRVFIELKENEKAIESLETLIKKFPQHPKAKDAMALVESLKK